MPTIIIRDAFNIPEAHRQYRLGVLQRLNGARLIHTQHQGVLRRIQIQPKTSLSFSMKKGSVDNVEERCQRGWMPNRFR